MLTDSARECADRCCWSRTLANAARQCPTPKLARKCRHAAARKSIAASTACHPHLIPRHKRSWRCVGARPKPRHRDGGPSGAMLKHHHPSVAEHSETTRSTHLRQRSNRNPLCCFRRKYRVLWRIEAFVRPSLRLRCIASIHKLWWKRRQIRGPAPRSFASFKQLVSLPADPSKPSPSHQGFHLPLSIPLRRASTGSSTITQLQPAVAHEFFTHALCSGDCATH